MKENKDNVKESAEEINQKYELWWSTHEKNGFSYKAYSHRKRTIEFVQHLLPPLFLPPSNKEQSISSKKELKDLFTLMSEEHGLTLLESELNDIFYAVVGKKHYVDYSNWLLSNLNKEVLSEKPHECKFYVNADWSYLRCECGKRIKPGEAPPLKACDHEYQTIFHNDNIDIGWYCPKCDHFKREW